MIKIDNITNRSGKQYLSRNPDFRKQLLITLNQVNGLNPDIKFSQDWYGGRWDYFFDQSSYEKANDAFVLWNDKIDLISPNRDDLLNVNYYQKLMDLVKNYHLQYTLWRYYPNDLVVQKYFDSYHDDKYINVKLEKSINKYSTKEIKAIACFVKDIQELVLDGRFFELILAQFKEDWCNEFEDFEAENIKTNNIAFTFDLKDFENPLMQIRHNINEFSCYKLKDILKADSQLMHYLQKNNLVNKLKMLKDVNIKQNL